MAVEGAPMLTPILVINVLGLGKAESQLCRNRAVRIGPDGKEIVLCFISIAAPGGVAHHAAIVMSQRWADRI